MALYLFPKRGGVISIPPGGSFVTRGCLCAHVTRAAYSFMETSASPKWASYRNHYAANFSEFRKAEVRRIPKFSGSSAVASRNRLLRFLAPFVATWSGYRGWSGSCTPKGDSFEGGEPEIATSNFREF